MIPVGDNIKTRHFPIVVLALVAANCVMFYHELSLDTDVGFLLSLGPRAGEFIQRWGLTATQLMYSPDRHVFLTVITSMFMHGSIAHLALNILPLWIFGNNVEDKLGHISFLFFYLACGVAAAGAQVFFEPDSARVMVGASGAIAGVMGGFLLRFPFSSVTVIPPFIIPIPIRIPSFVFFIIWFVYQVMSALKSGEGAMTEPVAWYAHIGGFMAGVVLVLFMPKRSAGRKRRDYPVNSRH